MAAIPILIFLISFGFPVGRAHVFFSSPISKELVAQIKKDSTVLPRIGGLREVVSLGSKYILFLTLIIFKKTTIIFQVDLLYPSFIVLEFTTH